MNAITLKQNVKLGFVLFLFLISLSCNTSSDYHKEEVSLENVDLRDDYNVVNETEETTSKSNGLTTSQTDELLKSNIPENLKIIKEIIK